MLVFDQLRKRAKFFIIFLQYSKVIGAVWNFFEVFWCTFLDFYIFRTFTRKKIQLRKREKILKIFLFWFSKVIGVVWVFLRSFYLLFWISICFSYLRGKLNFLDRYEKIIKFWSFFSIFESHWWCMRIFWGILMSFSWF